MLLDRSILWISKLILQFTKVIAYLICSAIAGIAIVLLYKNQGLLEEIRYALSLLAFTGILALFVLLLIAKVRFSFYIILFLEISCLFNILVLILYEKIKIPIRFVQ